MDLSSNNILIKQEMEVAEIFTDFETKNNYTIYDSDGNSIGAAAEESKTLSRAVTQSHRALKLHIADENGKDEMILQRKFFWFLTDYNVFDSKGNLLGKIKQKFSFFKKKFNVYNPQGELIFKCIAKMPHPWTFNIFSQGQEVARINKKWTGMGKETFTDADIINVNFGSIQDQATKRFLIAIAFAFDLTFFEKGG